LHDALDAPVSVQVSPHALQFAAVFSVVQVVPPHRVSRHVQEPFWQSGAGCEQVVWLTKVPAAPHV
jgi:hypothetical protein